MTNLNTILSQNSKFKEWYEKQRYQSFGKITFEAFLYCPFSMQYGVILEWLREQGIIVDLQFNVESPHEPKDGFYQFRVYPKEDYWVTSDPDYEQYHFVEDIDFDTGLTEAILNAIQLTEGEG